MKSKQIKSKQRVSRYGEVFTAEREVNAMVDFVDSEARNIDSTFLEPACGNGNFLIEILRRKLQAVTELYGNSRELFERYALKAVSTIYGVDIQKDNVIESRLRLFNYFVLVYRKVFGCVPLKNVMDAVKVILFYNICSGNTLTYLNSEGLPLRMPEWTLLADGSFKVNMFFLENLEPDNSVCFFNWQKA